MTKPRIVFMGTPEFAVPALVMLAGRSDCDVRLVVTQPDRKAGRGKKLTAPAVKIAAEQLGLPIQQTDSLRHPEVKARIIQEQPDLVVVAAFGMILGRWILELPTRGCVNLHASLLPKYRGASPISAAILAGDAESGVTLMRMDRGLDTGCIMDTIRVDIDADDTTESLTPRLAIAGARLLEERLQDLVAGTIECVPQPEGATHVGQLRKDDGRIDWSASADQIERLTRAMWPWPRAWTEMPNGERMQVHAGRVHDAGNTLAGEIQIDGKRVVIGTGAGDLELVRVQLPGGSPIEGQAILQKLGPLAGATLRGQQGQPNES